MELALADKAVAALRELLAGKITVTHVFGRGHQASDDHVAWLMRVRLSNGYGFTFWVEGRNLANPVEASDATGTQLVGGRHPINILGQLDTAELLDLENLLMGMHDQVYTAIQ